MYSAKIFYNGYMCPLVFDTKKQTNEMLRRSLDGQTNDALLEVMRVIMQTYKPRMLQVAIDAAEKTVLPSMSNSEKLAHHQKWVVHTQNHPPENETFGLSTIECEQWWICTIELIRRKVIEEDDKHGVAIIDVLPNGQVTMSQTIFEEDNVYFYNGKMPLASQIADTERWLGRAHSKAQKRVQKCCVTCGRRTHLVCPCCSERYCSKACQIPHWKAKKKAKSLSSSS